MVHHHLTTMVADTAGDIMMDATDRRTVALESATTKAVATTSAVKNNVNIIDASGCSTELGFAGQVGQA